MTIYTSIHPSVFSNLISNAVKFTDEGGEIKVGLSRNGDKATITVSDTGCGMSKDVGMMIFEKFYQGDTSRASEGNGLGLSIAKNLCELQRGRLEISIDGDLFKANIILPRS